MTAYESQRTETRRVLQAAERQGFKIKNGSSHLKVFAPDGSLSLVISHAPRHSDHDIRGMVKKLKRSGFRESV